MARCVLVKRYLLVLALLASCGHGDKITLHGHVRDASGGNIPTTQADCSVNPLADHQITIRDGSGNATGTTVTTGSAGSPVSHALGITACSFSGAFSVELPKADFYSIQVEGGGGDTQPEPPISFSDLQAQGFEHDVTLRLLISELP